MKVALLGLLSAGMVACGEGDDGGGGSSTGTCASTCAQSIALACPQGEHDQAACEASCNSQRSACSSQKLDAAFQTYLDCIQSHPMDAARRPRRPRARPASSKDSRSSAARCRATEPPPPACACSASARAGSLVTTLARLSSSTAGVPLRHERASCATSAASHRSAGCVARGKAPTSPRDRRAHWHVAVSGRTLGMPGETVHDVIPTDAQSRRSTRPSMHTSSVVPSQRVVLA